MSENKQAKCHKWQITINNPAEKSYTHTKIKEKSEKFSSIKYLL